MSSHSRYRHAITVLILSIIGLSLAVPVRGVVLPDEVEVRTEPFTLNKIAEGEIPDELSGILLGDLPEPGSTRVISQALILMQARRQGKAIPRFEGPVRQVRVKRPYRTLTRDDLRDPVRNLLRDELAVKKGVRVSVKELPEKLRILPGSYQLELEKKNPYDRNRGTSRFQIRVIQSGSSVRTFRIKASISQKNLVPVVTEPIARGQTVRASMIKWKNRDITSLSGNIVTSEKNVIGYKTKRSLDPGEIITGDVLKKPIVIDRRTPVTIVDRKNGLTITTKGKALEDGARGDRIMVENQSSEVKLLAEVIGERRVLIKDDSD